MSEAQQAPGNPARRVPIATLLHLPARKPAQTTASPEQLLAERTSAHAAARDELLPRIQALELSLAQAEAAHAAELLATRELALRLFASVETLMAAELADLTHAIATAVLSAEPHISSGALATLIAEAQSGLPRGILHVPPEALEAARALCPDGWVVEPHAALPSGTVEAVAGPALQQQSLAGRLNMLMQAAP